MSEGARKMATAGRLAAGTGSGAVEREAVATNADSTHPRCGSVKEKTQSVCSHNALALP